MSSFQGMTKQQFFHKNEDPLWLGGCVLEEKSEDPEAIFLVVCDPSMNEL
jgi:hypothetical protein